MLFFSNKLLNDSRYKALVSDLQDKMSTFKLDTTFISGTHDIWLRDFMPIQAGENRFIQYRYDPDYLKNYPHLRTDPGPICESLGLNTIKIDIILDGGNVILSGDCLIMIDKVVRENRHRYTRKELLYKLHELFEIDKVVLIGWDGRDIYGHADGMVRFINDRTVLLSDFYANDPEVTGPLTKAGLDIEILSFQKKRPSQRRWAYMNFLQAHDIFLLPKLNIPEDDMALEQMKYYFPSYAGNGRITQVDCTSIVDSGGALNCISWNTYYPITNSDKFTTGGTAHLHLCHILNVPLEPVGD